MNTVNNPFETILNELSEIRADIRKLKQPEPPAFVPDSLTKEQAIEHLRDIGYPIRSGQFYKLTAKGTIPSKRIGKRLILSRKELDQWVESLKFERVTHKQRAAILLAESVNKKLERVAK